MKTSMKATTNTKIKALILNSGQGTRMGDIKTCKCLVEVAEGKTIVDLQMQALLNCGVSDICVTTGPYADRLENHLRKNYPEATFEFVNNPIYSETNYIYSIYLAREFLQEDILMLHGDLLTEIEHLKNQLSYPNSCMMIDSKLPLSPKDFKAVISGGEEGDKITAVGVEFFENAVYAQPLYKLLWNDWKIWLEAICRFCESGNVKVYAENAFNEISGEMNLHPFDACGSLCFEVDNMDDLAYARSVYKDLIGA